MFYRYITRTNKSTDLKKGDLFKNVNKINIFQEFSQVDVNVIFT